MLTSVLAVFSCSARVEMVEVVRDSSVLQLEAAGCRREPDTPGTGRLVSIPRGVEPSRAWSEVTIEPSSEHLACGYGVWSYSCTC